jgi:hypothetical protein
MWRSNPDAEQMLCNACGIWASPPSLIHDDNPLTPSARFSWLSSPSSFLVHLSSSTDTPFSPRLLPLSRSTQTQPQISPRQSPYPSDLGIIIFLRSRLKADQDQKQAAHGRGGDQYRGGGGGGGDGGGEQ